MGCPLSRFQLIVVVALQEAEDIKHSYTHFSGDNPCRVTSGNQISKFFIIIALNMQIEWSTFMIAYSTM
jgi:hypothetical protein